MRKLAESFKYFMAAPAYWENLPGASGGAEGSFLLFFRAFFVDGTVLPAMVIWRALTYYLNFPAGCICAYIAGRLPVLKLAPVKESSAVRP